MVLAPLDLNMSAKELQNLNSSRYCNTSFFVFLVKTSWKHCQSGLVARFQFDLGTSTWFDGTWGPLSRNVSWISRICLTYSWYITLATFPYSSSWQRFRFKIYQMILPSIFWVWWLTVWVSETIEWNIGWDDRQFWNDGTFFGVASGYVLLKTLWIIWNSTASVASSLTSRSKAAGFGHCILLLESLVFHHYCRALI